MIEEMAAEFTTAELDEFLEADRYPVDADPEFKEQLRDTLWKLVQRSSDAEPDQH